ncbi:hypothetical protein FJP69_03895 [Stenotrophomonas maltophilia]|nr:hypothetical protein FJP69_03895 [Stenotrophomonas maltophilia]
MKTATLAKVIAGHYSGVNYEAKAGVSVMGGYKAGYRFNMKGDWTWGDGSFESLDAAIEAGSALAREAIASGRHAAEDNAS